MNIHFFLSFSNFFYLPTSESITLSNISFKVAEPSAPMIVPETEF